MAREYRFVIPVLPPSVNALHNIIYSQRKVVLKPEILKWRSDIALFIPRIQLEPESLVSVDVTFSYPFNYANGKLRRFDTHNMVKVLLDVIAWKANFDDSRVKEGSWKSIDSRNEQVEVVLRELCAANATAPATSSL
jgi:Holliday junction resolvase RusA-like endonuclease